MYQLPEPEEAAKKTIRRLLTAGSIYPVMNNTKWAELIQAMLDAPHMNPAFRLRGILAPRDHCTGWDREWHYHIHPVAEIEWLEIQAGSLDWLLSTLRKHHIPFSLEAGIPRVWGYTKPGMQPLWQ
ncbi:DUF6678 family protein [Pseudomonas cremoricolorata]|uniref:DUF6678 family protein n=1 Tax=Pseudomonas cremoricolorata TaxID=157783 RepID=UPI0012B5B2FA|nr:DUF6678 family protein [Pseudomonas cremoricolorata]